MDQFNLLNVQIPLSAPRSQKNY